MPSKVSAYRRIIIRWAASLSANSAVTRSTSFSSVILVSPTGARHHIRSPLHFNILSQLFAAHLVQVLSSLRSALQPAPLCSNQPAHLRPGWALRCFRISIATGSGRGTPYLRGRYNAQRGPPPRSPKYAAPGRIATGYNTHAFPPVILQCN